MFLKIRTSIDEGEQALLSITDRPVAVSDIKEVFKGMRAELQAQENVFMERVSKAIAKDFEGDKDTCDRCDSELQDGCCKNNRCPYYDPASIFAAIRSDHPCTPEEQAGPDAIICGECKRMTIHQHTGECMACKC